MIEDVVVPALLAMEKPRGTGRRLDITGVVCGIVYVLHEGVRWRALPGCFGKWSSVYTRFSRWTKRGVIEVLFELVALRYQRGKLRKLDASHVKVHQDANTGNWQREGVGKTRGGRNTKIHAVVDACGHATDLGLSAGNLHDSKLAAAMTRRMKAGQKVVADKAYDTDELRAFWESLGLGVCVPPRANRTEPAEHDKRTYKKRHKVENFFQRAKRCRRLGTRYEKTGEMFLSFLTLFAIIDYFIH